MTRDATEPWFEREINHLMSPPVASSQRQVLFLKQKTSGISAGLCLTQSPSPLAAGRSPGANLLPGNLQRTRDFWSLPLAPGERKMNAALENSSKRLIKGRASQMSQRSRFWGSPPLPEGPPACQCLCSGWVCIPLSSGCPQAAPCEDRPLQTAALCLCGLHLSPPHGSLWLFKCGWLGKGAAQGSLTAGRKNRQEKVAESRQKGEFPSSGICKCPGGKFGRFLLPKKKADAMNPCKFAPTAAEQVSSPAEVLWAPKVNECHTTGTVSLPSQGTKAVV